MENKLIEEIENLLIKNSKKCFKWVLNNYWNFKTNSFNYYTNYKMLNELFDFFKIFQSLYFYNIDKIYIDKLYKEIKIYKSNKPHFINYILFKKKDLKKFILNYNLDLLSEICGSFDSKNLNNLFEEASNNYEPMKYIKQSQLNFYHHFCPLNIQYEIEQNCNKHLIYKYKSLIGNITLNSYYTEKEIEEKDIGELFNRIKIIKHLTNYKNSNITIHLWNCNIPKKIPSIKSIGSYSVNSACTFIHTCNQIKIWRKEEFKKVIIHELLHCIGVDFHNEPLWFKTNIHNVFNIYNTNILLAESYVELWSLIFNIFNITLYFEKEKHESILNLLFNFEMIYSIFQISKILHHFKFNNFSEFFNEKGFTEEEKKKSLYKETSNIISYYIIKSALLFNLNSFYSFCIKNNLLYGLKFIETENNYNLFFNLVLESLKNKSFQFLINHNIELIKYNNSKTLDKKLNEDNYIFENLRMTCIEMI